MPVGDHLGEVALVDGDRMLHRVHAPAGVEVVVHQGVFFQQVELAVMAQRLGRLHRQAIAANPAEGIAVRADEEVDVRGAQRLLPARGARCAGGWRPRWPQVDRSYR